MELTAENTAIVVDSTADFPEAPERFPNWRVVPLYVRFGDESFRDYVELGPHDFYARLRTSTETPSTSQPTPGRLPRRLRGARRLRADPLDPHRRRSSRAPSRARARPPASSAATGCASIDSRTASAAIAMLGLAIQRRLERGTTDEEVDALVERYTREARAALHGRHARVPRRGGRIGRARAMARAAPEHQADPDDRGRRGRPGQARAREPEGFHGVRQRSRRHGRPAGPTVGIAHADAPEREAALRSWCATRPIDGIELSRRSARSSARTPGRERSGSSGSTTS